MYKKRGWFDGLWRCLDELQRLKGALYKGRISNVERKFKD